MFYVISCRDKPDHQAVRMANRPDHVEYLKANRHRIFAAGPTLSEDGEGMTGSVLIMDFADRGSAQAFTEDDPYNKAGLFESVTIQPWKKVLPEE